MKTILLTVATAWLGCGLASGQATRDFLTPDETEQLRLTALDPNARLKLYVVFARQRVDQLEQQFASSKAGRSILIHDLLDEFTKIIEAIDTVSDDALKRKLDIGEGMAEVVQAEKEMLAKLEKFQESAPKDLARYKFSLDQAIDATRDSAELSAQDLAERGREVEARDKKEKAEIEAAMQPKDLEQKKADSKKAGLDDEGKPKRKPPTLLKKGETIGGPAATPGSRPQPKKQQ
jgi:hypothetical protein